MQGVDGSDRLVVIFADGAIPIESQRVGRNLSVLIVKPGSLKHAAVLTQVLEPVHDAKNVEAFRAFRFFEGALDPCDSSRLNIDYEIDGRRGTIEGRLFRSGTVDRLQLQVLDGPAFEPDQVLIGGDSNPE
jgi:hypothetical protein